MIAVEQIATLLLGMGIVTVIFVGAVYLIVRRGAWELEQHDRNQLRDGR